ncbi:hypothetical protein ABPG72_014429 [Tetrahymena utriculariae]
MQRLFNRHRIQYGYKQNEVLILVWDQFKTHKSQEIEKSFEDFHKIKVLPIQNNQFPPVLMVYCNRQMQILINILSKNIDNSLMSGQTKMVKKVIFLSENSKIQRVSWAKKLLRNQKIALRNAVYTDETIIEFQNTRTQYQWVNGNGKQSEIKQEIKRWPQKVMIWAAIHMSGPIDIQIIEKNLNEEEYIKILTKFTNKTKDLNLQFFQQDNAPCHSTKKVLEFFKKNNKILLEWAPYSPDVNPIEKVWNILKQNLAKQISTCQDFQEYKQKCISIFETDKKVFGCIQQSIKNIPKILQQIIDSRGEITQ